MARRRPWFHLRACGEQAIKALMRRKFSVSPPRLRRTVIVDQTLELRHGFTSAPAENSNEPAADVAPDGFHLRACGEQIGSGAAAGMGVVSPPRLRRTGFDAAHVGVDFGFTSAPAENRPTQAADAPHSRFHLRACGEQRLMRDELVTELVSPPRLRRTGLLGHEPGHVLGFTSAPAENSRLAPRQHVAYWFHLRACGEQRGVERHQPVTMVSPPRLRRTVGISEPRGLNIGFTSAPAENSTACRA